jgi:hypothetical protein
VSLNQAGDPMKRAEYKEEPGVEIVTPAATIKEFDINDIHNYTVQGLRNKW